MSKVFRLLFLLCFSTYLHADPLSVPDSWDIEYPDDEPPSNVKVELGKTLFFDPRLSSNLKQSCASCHNPDLGFGDGLAKGLGTMGNSLSRNTPHLYNLAWNRTFFWDGRSDSLEDQALGPIQAEAEMNMSLEELIPRLQAVAYYRRAFTDVYGDEAITADRIAGAIASFERSIIVDDTPFDRYLQGDATAMSPAAIRGLALFEGKANCIACHDGANFTDESFHNLGTTDADPGRHEVHASPELRGAFKTPGLRNVLLTAPYMHDGSIATLEEVVRFYDRAGDDQRNLSPLIKPLKLSDQEVFDLVAFLGALTQPLDIIRPFVPPLENQVSSADHQFDTK